MTKTQATSVSRFSGVFTALVTPFKSGEIDWPSLRKLVRFQLDGGVNGFVVSGTTAESPTLSNDEKRAIFDFVRAESGGRVPIVVGTGSNSTAQTVANTQAAEKWGADGALVVVPYYNKPPQRGLFQHFQKVASETQLPIVLYNVPSRTITRLDVETIVELSEIENIVGIKEASGDLEIDRQLLSRLSEEGRESFAVTSGDDGTFIELIHAGGVGVISVASHILPKQFSDWCARARAGDSACFEEFQKYRALNDYLYCEANPIPVKMTLHLMGLIESPELRLPMVALTEPHTAALRAKMSAVGLL